jgi:hypothetical protein
MKRWQDVAAWIVAAVAVLGGITPARAQWLPTSADSTAAINRSGSVAIGASSTSYKFQVSSGRSIFEAGSEKYALGLRYSPSFGNTQFWLGASNSAAPDLILSNMNGGEVARFLASGSVGIGTSVPDYKFQVSAGRSIFEASYEKYALGLRYSGANGNSQFWLGASDSAAPSLLLSNADGVEVARFEAGGNVGIGMTPAAGIKLDVAGNIHASGSITGATVVGATYQDVAEWVPAAGDMPAGTVVVLDRTYANRVVASATSYDTSVAGVVSAAPGVLLGVSADSKKMIATVGRVKVKVDATRHPVAIGDLLVTSDRTGAAMVSVPVSLNGVMLHRPGTIIGKALEPLASGEGEILVLLSLQ